MENSDARSPDHIKTLCNMKEISMERDEEAIEHRLSGVETSRQGRVVVQRESGAEITFPYAHLYVDGDERKVYVMRGEDTLGLFAIDDVRSIYMEEVD
jgi:hypothetical protein